MNLSLFTSVLFFFTVFLNLQVFSQIESRYDTKFWSIKLADSFVDSHPGSVTYDSIMTKEKWNYEQGVMLESLHQMFLYSGDDKYFDFIKENIDQYVNEKGEIRTYKFSDFNIDNINTGRQLLFLYEVTGEQKYKSAADLLRKQLEEQPRTPSGGLWHKKIYPNQMWLDGLYMGQPFYAQYSKMFSAPEYYDDIAKQFKLIYDHTLDPETGLLYHAWDESKEQKWADPETGTSPHFWGRAIGWYLMAVTDVLDFFPADHPGRKQLINILQQVSGALIPYMDERTNLFYQVIDMGNRNGNYLETSASAMFAYAFAKGYNKKYLEEKYINFAGNIFEGIINEKVRYNSEGFVELYGTCHGAGLGGNPYRDGSYEYYIREPQRMNDYKGYGAFLLASIEIEKANKYPGKNITAGLDNYFNNEKRKNKQGVIERFHYIWEDTTDSGFYELGKIFQRYGARISTVVHAPATDNLSNLDIYIIVDPDTPKESESPNFIDDTSIKNIENWVKSGGILMLFNNDKGNAEFEHLNNLTEVFGFSFNKVSLNRVEGKKYDMGRFIELPYHPIFSEVNKIYMKGISTINSDVPEYIILKKDKENIIFFRRYGKGGVFAVGDPWLYNEYIDNRRLPNDFENYKAAENLCKWILHISELAGEKNN